MYYYVFITSKDNTSCPTTTGCESIHLEAVLVPQYRYRGSNASLLCKYELEPNEELFSLKWYKEDTEFYRHTPPDPLSQPPPMNNYGVEIRPPQQQPHHFNTGLVQTWPVPGIKIDEEHSRPQHVILKRVTFKSTGTYRCEVTAVLRQRNGYGIQGFEMKESINKMVVVGKMHNSFLQDAFWDLDFFFRITCFTTSHYWRQLWTPFTASVKSSWRIAQQQIQTRRCTQFDLHFCTFKSTCKS